MKKSRLLTSAALLLCVSMSLAGCGGGGASTGGSGSTPDTTTQAGSTSGQTTPAGTEKILKVATNWEKATFDPAIWTDGGGVRVGISLYETLLTLDQDRNIVPCLAESWEVSQDQKTYTFHLRKGVQFHGGYGEFTSQDVAFTLERLKDPAVGATESKNKCKLDNIASMDTSDPYVFVLHLKEPDNETPMDYASWYTNIVSKKAYEELSPSGFGLRPVGTGPFEYESGKPAESYIVKRFEGYWGEKAILDQVQVTMLSDEVNGINAFNAGEVDIMTLNDPNNIAKFKNTEGCEVKKVSDFQSYYLGMNTQAGPFMDPKVREAIKYAINYEEIINDYWRGTMLPAVGYVPSDCLFSADPAQTGFTCEYNPEKAKQLLAEAGYPNGFTTSVIAPNDSMSKGPLLVIQQYMAEIGVDMQLNLSEFATFIDDVRNGRSEMWFLVNGDGYRGDNWLTVFTSEKIPGSNWCVFQNPEYDELIKKGQASSDKAEKEGYYLEAQKILVESIPSVPIAESCTHILIRDRVKNLSLDPSNLFQYRYMDIQ